MKKHVQQIISIMGWMILFMSLPSILHAQAPQSFSYQAIVRDAGGNPLASQLVSIQMKLHQGTETGTVFYCETHLLTTNPLGLVMLEIGQGTVVSGSFQAIDWGSGPYFLELELDPAGGTAFMPMGTTQLVSVPYALYSDNVARIQDNPVAPATPSEGQVLQWDGLQWLPSTISEESGGWSLTGNSGTDPEVNFLGTTDNRPLKFRVNNLSAGEINPVNDNMFFGRQAGENSTGAPNVAIGSYALQSNVANSRTTAIGYGAMSNADDRTIGRETYNTAVGFEALKGSYLPANNTGLFNTALGDRALYANTTGDNNTASGTGSLYSNTTGQENTAVGAGALHRNTEGYNNTATGTYALFFNTTGHRNTAIGEQALNGNRTGNGNTSTGVAALGCNTEGNSNTASGEQALYSNTTGSVNTAIGSAALYSNKSNSRSTSVGAGAMFYADNRTEGRDTYNTAIGYEALKGSSTPANNTGQYNTAIGDQALYSNTTGHSNVAVGVSALYSNTTRNNLIAIGDSALYN
ncbi:MAG TPA: hypothetical protein P5184_01950, partial [Bacteroidales bacterium]|nr:hypothetical protein [Bacteroidales bacterium]